MNIHDKSAPSSVTQIPQSIYHFPQVDVVWMKRVSFDIEIIDEDKANTTHKNTIHHCVQVDQLIDPAEITEGGVRRGRKSWLVVEAEKTQRRCSCGNPDCGAFVAIKVLSSYLYTDLIEACADAQRLWDKVKTNAKRSDNVESHED